MSLLKLSQALIRNRVKQASAMVVAPVVAPVLDVDNATEAAIAGGGFAGLASTVGAPYTWGPEYELARTEEQLKAYKDLLKDPNRSFADKLKARVKYYNPIEAVKDYRAKHKAGVNVADAAKAGGKALAKSYLRSGIVGLGAAGLAAGYTRFGEDLLGDSYVAPSSLFSSEEEGMSTTDKLKLLAAGTLAAGAGLGYLGSSDQKLSDASEASLNKIASIIKKKKKRNLK